MRKVMLLLFLLALVLCGCQSFSSMIQEPGVSLNSVSIARITISGLNIIANVAVENRNTFSIPMPKVDWELFVNDSSFTQGVVEEDRSIGSRETVSLNIPISVNYDRLYRTFGSLAGLLGAGSKEVPYKIAMGLRFPIPLLENMVYRLDHSGTLPVPSL